MPQSTDTARVKIKSISKSFGGIRALHDINFNISPGEIHALVGENGAGKSTLVKIITGLETADTGTILIDEKEVQFDNPMDARANGVLAVYQDPKLFPNLDVAENVFMGMHPKTKSGFVDRKLMYKKTDEVLEWLGADLDPKALVVSLSIGQMQFVEFARAMFDSNEKLLLLDEPTASLSPNEAEHLFSIVRRLKERGVSIVFISHRLEELFDFAERITILRDGKHVLTENMGNMTQATIVQNMVGRSIQDFYKEDEPLNEEVKKDDEVKPLLEVKQLTSEGEFFDISFSVFPGEIVGMAGLVGAGRTEIAKAIFGAFPITEGSVFIEGSEISVKTPAQMITEGIVYVPEDREVEGLIADLSVRDNMILPSVVKLSRAGIVDNKKESSIYAHYKQQLQIKASGPHMKISALSGGNRQKVVLSKWMALNPKIIIFDEPTHGIDVGAKAQVHGLMRDLAKKGIGILMISSDLPEIIRISDRVLVVSDGLLVAQFSRSDATQENIMSAAVRSENVE